MGHADITTTMNIYAEATKEKKQQAMANLNGKIHQLFLMTLICKMLKVLQIPMLSFAEKIGTPSRPRGTLSTIR